MSCNTSTGNPGLKYCTNGNILTDPIGIILANDSQSFSSANFLLQASWNSAIEARSVFPIMELKDFTDNSTETNYHDYTDETRKFIRQGKYRFSATFEVNECTKKELMEFIGFKGRVYLVYEGQGNGVLRGSTTDSGTTIKGARIQEIVVEKETLPLKDGTPGMVTIAIDLKTYKDLNQYDYAREVSWDVLELDSLTEVDLAQVGTATATSLTVSVYGSCYGTDYPITGLAFADFAITGTGTLGVEGDFVDNGDGTYTFVTVGLITGDSVDLVAPASLSDDFLIKSGGAVTVTVTS